MKAKNSTAKKRRNSILSVCLICALLVTGIFAFLTATDSKTNKFTIGNVDVELHEDDWYDEDGNVLDDEDEDGIPDFAEDVLPGEPIVKAPYVENTGNNDAWTYLVVSAPVVPETSLRADEDGNVDIAGNATQIDIKTYAIQTGYITDEDGVEETAYTVWDKYLDNNGGIEEMFGEMCSDDDWELFEFLVNTADEGEDPDYLSLQEDGFSDNLKDWVIWDVFETKENLVYVFLLEEPLPAIDDPETEIIENQTAPIFDAVRLYWDIGEQYIEPSTNGYWADVTITMWDYEDEQHQFTIEVYLGEELGATVNLYDAILDSEEYEDAVEEFRCYDWTTIDLFVDLDPPEIIVEEDMAIDVVYVTEEYTPALPS